MITRFEKAVWGALCILYLSLITKFTESVPKLVADGAISSYIIVFFVYYVVVLVAIGVRMLYKNEEKLRKEKKEKNESI